ncbi:hypothetical protein [Streptomyces cylindrosporus]|uniref:Uncharacterized protein n=1 Tax=Streptomyces cylindrosporus TaxID=2927583 RepID=A0ABS9YQB2_9ACTN|nr:hypothetical protein [Streptomyces cylindrosporus]MCI3279089.1 hypothetical protein [Streptomyces cylindrosporus]
MTATKNATPPEPPAAAVAADAHWAATRERLRNRQRPTATLTICDDADAKKALVDAEFAVRAVTASLQSEPDDPGLKGDLATAEETLTAARTAFDEVAIVLRFQALRRPDFEDLKAKHPPTEAQAEDNLVVNVETLGPELISASSLDGITAEDAKYYLEEWGEGEASALFNTAWHVQSNARMDLGKG